MLSDSFRFLSVSIIPRILKTLCTGPFEDTAVIRRLKLCFATSYLSSDCKLVLKSAR